ncbi:MAG: NifB/NifX family molybdenum-iron cluster-binding protein [Candidatus Odinarchaeia archaeon]
MRIVVPLINDKGLESSISPHFGRAPFFGVVEVSEDGTYSVVIKSNTSQHFGGMGTPSENILSFQPDVLITIGMGPRAISILTQHNVKLFKAISGSLKDNIDAYFNNKLNPLDEPCEDAHHK